MVRVNGQAASASARASNLRSIAEEEQEAARKSRMSAIRPDPVAALRWPPATIVQAFSLLDAAINRPKGV
ncbi:MAG: hypothetical protein AABZ12_14385 [Planctomycetota bacterium]